MSELSSVKIGTLTDDECPKRPNGCKIPVVVRPAQDASHKFLVSWVAENKAWIVKQFYDHGAVIFRGFEVAKPQDFEDVIVHLSPNLGNDYLGTSPRTMLTKYTFTSTELPGIFPIPQHLEMSYLQKSTPGVIFFSCMKEAKTGGETPLCDFISVAKEIPEQTRKIFEKKGVIIVRNYVGPKQWSVDPWKLKRWPEIFKTQDHEKVKVICDKDELVPKWYEGDALQLTQRIPAFKTHPQHGTTVWANHSDVFHTSQAFGEYKYVAQFTGYWTHYILWILLYIATFIRVLLQKPQDQAMNALYGDENSIPDSEVEAVRKTIWKNMVIYKWKKGDIVMLDNHRVSHGRLPFTGDRLTICGWGDKPEMK